ncbi:trypsin-like peptidase domain-containing protein [Streptomyces sp. Je 1-369]|uniref:VMAP-C domain-containing protein n=1 Tax=Streptomyces sp. Je 1-369 TaxID=2966192 RepID=UPI00228560AD|nr:trypsin-like peptidase domain-containing protein [Streptomyces sp. Je 1-369]WAL98996.1 serine protease [Streptomyces sp. Je 1-369]
MHWRARIDTSDGAVRGAGVLIDRARLITCAHVVEDLAEVTVTLPGVAYDLPATVRRITGWQRPGDRGDLAVVELAEPLRVPPCVFAPLDALRSRKGRIAHELRAQGFPAHYDKEGTHVTLHTSADRMLGQEWLEVDVRHAHLRRLDEGFSGAAVYDPASGLVVGIITDADLGGEEEGVIGKMLPLDTIRGHWEEIDDLLPLDWLEPAARRELRTLVVGAPLDQSGLQLMVRQVCPTLRRDPPLFRSVWHAVRYTAEVVVGGKEERERAVARLLRMLIGSSTVSADTGALMMRCGLQKYDDAAAARAVVGPLAAPTGSIVVRAEPMTRGAGFDLYVRTVIGGVEVGRAGPVRVRRQQLRAKAEALLAGQVGKVHGCDWMLEFVVPQRLMNEPFDEWEIDEPGAERPWPMRTVPVVVRDLNRLKPVRASDRAGRRWETVRGRGETRPQRVECGLPYDFYEFRDWLDADDQLCALAYAATPARDWLEAALDTGVPIMLWRRHDCGTAGHAHCSPEKFLDRITDAVDTLDPARLPSEVMRLRREARSPVRRDAEHCGHRLTLFWDSGQGAADPPLSAPGAGVSGTTGAGAAGAEGAAGPAVGVRGTGRG